MVWGRKIVNSHSKPIFMYKTILKKCTPVLVALAVFAIIACVYCAPVFQGKELYAGDNLRFKEAVNESVQFHKDTGEYTWWTGSMFAGMPNYQVGGGHYKSLDLMKPLTKLLHPSHNTRLPLVIMLYFCCFYILFRSVKVDPWLSIVAALAAGLSSYYFIIEPAGHHTKAWSIALMSAVIGGFFLIFRKKYGLGVVITMIFTAMGFSPHPQMAYYVYMLIGVLFLAQLYVHVKEKKFKELIIATSLFAVSTIVGVGTGCNNILANSEYVKETQRGGHSDIEASDSPQKTKGLSIEYATQWSYGIDESLTFLIPGFKGNASGYNVGTDSQLYRELTSKGVSRSDAAQFCSSVPTYWGEQPFTAGGVYAGAAVCFLFVLGLILVKGPTKWALLVATFFSFALAWGKNWLGMTELFFNWFPLYSKFRSVSSILIVAEITVPLLGFLAVRELMDRETEKKIKLRALYISAGVTAGLCLLFALLGGSLFSFTSSNDASIQAQVPDWLFSAIVAERAAILRNDSFRSFAIIMLAAVVLWLCVNEKLKKYYAVAALGIIIVADMWQVDKRFFNDSNFVTSKQFQSGFTMEPYEKAILQDTDPHYRVLNLTVSTFNDSRTSMYLKSLGGYSAAKLRRYQDIIDQYLVNVDLDVVSMLNGKYVITKTQDGRIVPQRNPGALGNAWYVQSIERVQTPTQECSALGQVDLSKTAVIGSDYSDYVKDFRPAADSSTIRLTSYAPNALTYVSSSAANGTVVFSEIFYPYGWKAYIDGKPAQIFRANYLLRAMNIPAGQHEIRMEFDPDSVRNGNTIATIFIVIMYVVIVGLIAGTLIMAGRRRKSA